MKHSLIKIISDTEIAIFQSAVNLCLQNYFLLGNDIHDPHWLSYLLFKVFQLKKSWRARHVGICMCTVAMYK